MAGVFAAANKVALGGSNLVSFFIRSGAGGTDVLDIGTVVAVSPTERMPFLLAAWVSAWLSKRYLLAMGIGAVMRVEDPVDGSNTGDKSEEVARSWKMLVILCSEGLRRHQHDPNDVVYNAGNGSINQAGFKCGHSKILYENLKLLVSIGVGRVRQACCHTMGVISIHCKRTLQ